MALKRILRRAPYNRELIVADRWRVPYAPAYGWPPRVLLLLAVEIIGILGIVALNFTDTWFGFRLLLVVIVFAAAYAQWRRAQWRYGQVDDGRL